MEEYLDALLAFLIANVSTTPAISWILGDPGQSAPTSLPFGYIFASFDGVKALSGIDMDTYMVPILVVDDLHAYGPPVPNINVEGAFEQPGYRHLLQYAQTVRAALRAGGLGITTGGIAATSIVPAIRYPWLRIDNKPYRGALIAFQVQQRRART